MNRYIILITLAFLLIQLGLPGVGMMPAGPGPTLYAQPGDGIEQARRLLLDGDFNGAEKLLRKLEAAGSQAGEVNFYLGVAVLGRKVLQRSQAISIASRYFEKSARAGYYLKPGTWEDYPIRQDKFFDANWKAARKHLKDKDPQKIRTAENLLFNIIAIDYRVHEAGKNLGKLYLRTGQARKAIVFYRQVLEANPANNQEIYSLDLDFLDIYLPKEANMILECLSIESPENLSLLEKLFMARALFVLEKDSLAYDYYFRCLDSLDEVASAELYRDMTDIMFEKDRKNYEKASTLREKQMFFRKFWKAREALPAADYNERLVEHYRRLNHAKRDFHINMINGYDNRGRIYIKHGEPDQEATLFTYKRENVSWLYRKKPRDFIFHFLRRYTNYEIIPNLPPLLYESRSELDPFYFKFAELVRIGELSQMDITELTMEENELLVPAFTLGETTETFKPYQGIDPLNYYFAMADFISPSSNSSLYVYYGLPLREIELKPDSSGKMVDYECTFAIFDQEWNEVSRALDKRSYRVRPDLAKIGKGSLIVDNQILNIPPGDYHYAVKVKDLNSSHLGIYQGDIEVTSYERGRFNVSRVVLATGITRVERSAKPDKFARGGLRVMPLPSVAFRRDQAVFIYYEIYFLTEGSDGRKHYNVDFSIQADKLDRNLASKVFGTLGKLVGKKEEKERITLTYDKEQDNPERIVQQEYITIDISDSPPGKYSFEITVTDAASGDKVTRSTYFTITKAG